MSAQHTPGPWEWDSKVWDYDPKNDAPWLVAESGNQILSGEIECGKESDARLIAAAPELLAACIALQMEAAARGCGLRIADEAIAKATGAAS